MRTSFLFFFLIIFSSLTPLNSYSKKYGNRRVLHQPFFPLDSLPPTTQPPFQSPQPQPQQQQPKYPFSSLSPPNQQNPFFPVYPSPPPPPPTASLATFPANISSLILPQTSSSASRPISRKLIAVAVSLSLLSAVLVAVVAAFLIYHRRHRNFSDDKASRADSLRLFPPNTATSDGVLKPPHPRNVSNTSSEFLYLGTLRGIEDDENIAPNSSNSAGGSSMPGYQRLGSPELQPLPPLPRQNIRQSQPDCKDKHGSDGENEEDEEEEFFSPRASSVGKRSPKSPDSSSRRVFMGAEAENFPSRSSNSRTASYPSSTSASPTCSMSSSPFIQLNLSPRRLRPKSPDSLLDFPAPSRPPPAIPSQTLPQSPPKMKILSPSPPSTPEKGNSGHTQNSPVRPETVIGQSTPIKLPPPPPPLPPPGFWELPAAQKAMSRDPGAGPPVLVGPSRPVVLPNPELGSAADKLQSLEAMERNEETPKPKLKPLHWDKVRASSDRAMVWDQLKSSSFQLNEEMIETLFVVNTSSAAPKDIHARRAVPPMPHYENRVLDPKKSQNIAILLRALNVTINEVCEALLEGSADAMGTELLESLLKMAPTKEEERKLREFKDESPFKLGPAEKFLRAVLDIPFAFQRVEAMLYIANFDSEVEYLKRSFETLEAACEELRSSRMFLKLLEAVLKTGNRMNVGTKRGDACAFKLDTLLKLVDVKGTDGKTSLLHFVVQEISRAEGSRLTSANQGPTSQQSALQDDVEFRKLGLQVVSGLSGDLTNVKKAAAMDSDILSSEVAKLARGITKIREVLKLNEEVPLKECSQKFMESMNDFLKKAEVEIERMQTQETAAFAMVKEVTEYFHGDLAKEEAHPLRIFMVVRDFLFILDQVCKEVGKINERSIVSSARQFPLPTNPSLPPVFPLFNGRQQDGSSDDESSSSP
ncbi:hypothetical protein NMG60_11028129 [Bertholletia excelsa]